MYMYTLRLDTTDEEGLSESKVQRENDNQQSMSVDDWDSDDLLMPEDGEDHSHYFIFISCMHGACCNNDMFQLVYIYIYTYIY